MSRLVMIWFFFLDGGYMAAHQYIRKYIFRACIHSFDPFFIFPISPSYSISTLNCSIIHSSLAQWSQEGWQPNSGDMLSRPWSRHGVVWPWPLHVYKISSSKTHPLYLYKWSIRSRAYENTLKGCRLRTDYGNQFL